MRYSAIAIVLLIAGRAVAAEPTEKLDVSYTEPKHDRQQLDVYAPGKGQDHPVLFWIHGGGWQTGDKSEAKLKPRAFVDKGFVFVSTNYRFLPDATIPEIAADVAKAIRWTHDHAKEYGGNPNGIIVMGHSAGAQLAALVCTDQRYLKAEGLLPTIINGCVCVDGDTYDLPTHIAEVEKRRFDFFTRYFGDEASQRELSSVTHIAKAMSIPPFLILHVANHPETGDQSRRLAKALCAAEIPASIFAAEDRDHITLNDDLGAPNDKATQALFEFVDGLKLVKFGDDNVISGTEIERNEKTSQVRIYRKPGAKISSVGGSMFIVEVLYKIAKVRRCEYFVLLDETDSEKGTVLMTVGYTNQAGADIKQEFGAKFSDQRPDGEKRGFLSVSDYSLLFEKKP